MYKNTRAFLLLPARSPLTQFIRPLVVNFFPAFSFKIAAPSRTTLAHVHLLPEQTRFFYLFICLLFLWLFQQDILDVVHYLLKGPMWPVKRRHIQQFSYLPPLWLKPLWGTFMIYWFWWLLVKKDDSDKQSELTLSECRAVPPDEQPLTIFSRILLFLVWKSPKTPESILDNFTIAIYVHCHLSLGRKKWANYDAMSVQSYCSERGNVFNVMTRSCLSEKQRSI